MQISIPHWALAGIVPTELEMTDWSIKTFKIRCNGGLEEHGQRRPMNYWRLVNPYQPAFMPGFAISRHPVNVFAL